MKKKLVVIVAMLGWSFAFSAAAQAEVVIEWVTVGDAGNPDDIHGDCYGAVDYEYQISKYEVTNEQYIEFLNAVAETDTYGLYNVGMSGEFCGIDRDGDPGSYTYAVNGGDANWNAKPVGYVSWYDVLRFANWIHNGQPTGEQDASTTEDGAYDMSLGSAVTRKAGARVFLCNEDEWYKAAFYKGGGTDAGYWDYATQSDAIPVSEAPPGGGNSANYYDGGFAVGEPYLFSDVGAYTGSDGAYGTFDQNGNSSEWNETLIGTNRGVRGGSFLDVGTILPASSRLSTDPLNEFGDVGFRLGSPVVLEPIPAVSEWGIAVMMLFILAAGTIVFRRCRTTIAAT